MANANLQSASRLEYPTQSYGALLRCALGRKPAEPDNFVPNLQPNAPYAGGIFIYTNEAGECFPHQSAPVLAIDGWRYVSKVFDSVVCFVPVYVINVHCWPRSIHIEPRKPMAKVGAPIKPDDYISIPPEVASNVARFFVALARSAPEKLARGLVVIKKFAQALRGKIGLSHDAVLSQIGQRLTCVRAHGGLRYFGA